MSFSNANLPRKRVGATALFINDRREIMIVKPTYRQGWLTPGGTVNEDESPQRGCAREVREELGLDIEIGRLLGLGYRSAHRDKVENIQFVFWGGHLSTSDLERIVLQRTELSEYRFCPAAKLEEYLNAHLANRFRLALSAHEAGTVFYEENRVLS